MTARLSDAWLRANASGYSLEELALLSGVSASTIRRRLTVLGVHARAGKPGRAWLSSSEVEEVLALVRAARAADGTLPRGLLAALGRKFHVSRQAIHQIVKKGTT